MCNIILYSKQTVFGPIDQKGATYAEIALDIWNYAEMGYQEEKSSALLQAPLRNEGFTIRKGVVPK